MGDPTFERRVAHQAQTEAATLMPERTRLLLRLGLLAFALFSLAEQRLNPGEVGGSYRAQLPGLVVMVLALLFLPRPAVQRWAAPLYLAVLAVNFAVIIPAAALVGRGLPTIILYSCLALLAATLMPWSLWYQLALVSLALHGQPVLHVPGRGFRVWLPRTSPDCTPDSRPPARVLPLAG
jgi:hypothetical protein